MSLEQCNIAIQAALPDDKVPMGISLVIVTRSSGGALAVPIAQSVFQQRIRQLLSDIVPASVLSGSGATDVVYNVESVIGKDPAAVQRILAGFNSAVTRTFLVVLVLSALMLPFALLIEWKGVKKERKEEEDGKEKRGRKDDRKRAERRGNEGTYENEKPPIADQSV